MPRWEYRMEQSPPGAPDETGPAWVRRLGAAGADGWELVSEHLVHLGDGRVRYTGTLKRPAGADAPPAAAVRSAPAAPSAAPPAFAPPVADEPASEADRFAVLRGLVATGILSEADAAELAPGGKVTDPAWAIVQSLQTART